MQPTNIRAAVEKTKEKNMNEQQVSKTSQRGEAGPGTIIFFAVFGIVVILGLAWVVQGNDFFLYKVFAPKYEQVRHDTYKNSQAYNDGMMQELRHAQRDYEQASPEHKDALASVVLHQFAEYDEDRLPSDLRAFVEKLRREQLTSFK